MSRLVYNEPGPRRYKVCDSSSDDSTAFLTMGEMRFTTAGLTEIGSFFGDGLCAKFPAGSTFGDRSGADSHTGGLGLTSETGAVPLFRGGISLPAVRIAASIEVPPTAGRTYRKSSGLDRCSAESEPGSSASGCSVAFA